MNNFFWSTCSSYLEVNKIPGEHSCDDSFSFFFLAYSDAIFLRPLPFVIDALAVSGACASTGVFVYWPVNLFLIFFVNLFRENLGGLYSPGFSACFGSLFSLSLAVLKFPWPWLSLLSGFKLPDRIKLIFYFKPESDANLFIIKILNLFFIL